jgi:hypothetical protein
VKKILPFLARLLVISLLFIPVLPYFHQSYKFALVLITTATMPTSGMMANLPYDGSNNLYTFLVLILAIPGMEIKKRVIGIVTGISLFLFADFFMTAVWIPYLKSPRPSLANMAVSYGWLVVAHYMLPFLLWLAFAFREIEELFRGATSVEENI